MNFPSQDTIAAIATPPGIGAIGIIRLSGNEAIAKANLLFPRKDLSQAAPNSLHYGPLLNNGELLDEVIVSVFKAPHSYTGEDVIEISTHGSSFILGSVMEALVNIGVRPAKAGEFTMRAFMNGKMDLAQAEAVADLIESESSASRHTALNQMRGGFSKKIKELRAQLLNFAALIELELDFAEEDVEFANRDHFRLLLNEIESEVTRLAESFKLGNVIKNGIKTVIAGRPNAGKSTLLNTILNEERAIVSDVPGTTRDTIEDTITIEGILFRFIDTAGIRTTSDTLENIGIGRTMEKLNEANLILYLFDVNETDANTLKSDLNNLPADIIVIPIGNKTDIDAEKNHLKKFNLVPGIVFISAKETSDIDLLKFEILSRLDLDKKQIDQTLVTNARHYHILVNIRAAIENIRTGLTNNITTDLIAADIRHAIGFLSEITGEVTNNEILGHIFGKFCIGK